MSAPRFELDEQGLADYLKHDPALRSQLERMAAAGEAHAKSIAPVGDPRTDPHSGAYRDSIVGAVRVGRSRMAARIAAYDPKASWIEFGAANTRKQRVLGQALERAAHEIA
jgi:hypothetical protein